MFQGLVFSIFDISQQWLAEFFLSQRGPPQFVVSSTYSNIFGLFQIFPEFIIEVFEIKKLKKTGTGLDLETQFVS